MKKKQKNEKLKEFKLPKNRRQPIFKFFSAILLKPLFRVKTQSKIKSLPDKAIVVSIHAAKYGPMSLCMSYPKYSAIWGHHAMLGSYKDRFKYLRDVLYVQKMHKNKFISTIKALFEAFFSIFFYKGMKVIGTYTDMRQLSTIRNSIGVLEENASVIVFPEDSSEGYFDEIKSAFPGFVMLASIYYSKTGEDVPVIPAYVSRKRGKKRLVIGEPRYVHELELNGKSKQEIADILKDDINALYRDYIQTKKNVISTIEDAPVRTKEYYNE